MGSLKLFPGVLKGVGGVNHLSINGKNIPHSTTLTQNTPSVWKFKPENSENYVFWTNFILFPQIWTSSSPISGLNSKFLYATLCVLNRSLIRVWSAKILYRNLIVVNGPRRWDLKVIKFDCVKNWKNLRNFN